MIELTPSEAQARVRSMMSLVDTARDLELEGCGVRVSVDGGRISLTVDFAAKRAVDPVWRHLRDWGNGKPWPASEHDAGAEKTAAAAPEDEKTAPAALEAERTAAPAPQSPSVKPAGFQIVAAPPTHAVSEAPRPGPIAAVVPETGQGAPWTHERDVELGEMLGQGLSWAEIAERTGRGEGALMQRVKRLGGRGAVIEIARKAAAVVVDPDAPGALAAHLERVSPDGFWTREMDRELIRLAVLGWTPAEVDAQDLTGVGIGSKARKAKLTLDGRWSIYEVAQYFGVDDHLIAQPLADRA